MDRVPAVPFLAFIAIAIAVAPVVTGCIEAPEFFEADQDAKVQDTPAEAETSPGDDGGEVEVEDTLDAEALNVDVAEVADSDAGDLPAPEVDAAQEVDAVGEVDAEIVIPPECTNANDCDDSNVCTLDACEDGDCEHTPTLIGGSCEDGFLCTVSDTCNTAGECVGTIVVCDDGNACTQDACDPATGACNTKPVPDGQSCSTGINTCTEVCTEGACGCDCPLDELLVLTLPGLSTALPGTVVINPSGSAIDETYTTLSSAGPLVCPNEWIDAGALVPQVTGYPVSIEWTRPCTGPDPFRDRANQFQAAGGTYWKARDAGLTEPASVNVTAEDLALFQTLPNFHVISVTPSVGECSTQEVVTMRANVPEDLQIRFDVSGINAFRAARLTLSIPGNPDAHLESPLEWSPSLIPVNGSPATLTIVNPCGGTVTDALFGDEVLQLWANSSRSGTIDFIGFEGTYLGAANFYGGTVTQAGTCVNGQQVSTVQVDVIDVVQ